MKLISCDECGVILDQDKIIIPNAYGDRFQPIIECPVYKLNIVLELR